PVRVRCRAGDVAAKAALRTDRQGWRGAKAGCQRTAPPVLFGHGGWEQGEGDEGRRQQSIRIGEIGRDRPDDPLRADEEEGPAVGQARSPAAKTPPGHCGDRASSRIRDHGYAADAMEEMYSRRNPAILDGSVIAQRAS